MNLAKLIGIFLFPVLSWGISSKYPLTPLDLKSLAKLSSQSFRIDVDPSGKIRLNGRWPNVCAKTSAIGSQRSQNGLGIIINVTDECLNLLKLSPAQIAKLPQSSMKKIIEGQLLKSKESVFIKSTKPKLDLTFNYEDVEKMKAKENLFSVHPAIDADNDQARKNLYTEPKRPTNEFDSSINYRGCKPNDYGVTDPEVCRDRHGIDLNADIPLGPGSKIVGTTRFDFVLPNRLQDSFADNLGVNVQFVHEISGSVGSQ
ncbi:MAG: hypothetical protein RJB66_1111 [Pseudomonadota bacterium]|jgi:hypothetical protein